ncbi:MAG: GreA/GreB family elongation factor [Puniceicoccales bacterium]|jgi:transcription elongation GreA/GreB family factor|nr:GreA/GreB family elongation factor [Puniceicoccales bacterium]
MNNDAIEHLLNAKPALRNSREKLEAMRDGAYCFHRSWGFGQIQRYDQESNRLLIDFPESGKTAHPMAPEFCIEKLTVYPPENILVRQKTDPGAVEKLIKGEPAELVREVLLGDPERSMSAIELDGILVRLMSAPVAKKWWTNNRKFLVKDPRIAVPAKKDGHYVLREEPVNPEQEILDKYHLNKNPLKKILLAEKLFESSLRELARTDAEGAKSTGDTDENAAPKTREKPRADAKTRAETTARKHVRDLIEADLQKIFDELTNVINSGKRITHSAPGDEDAVKEARELAARLHGIWVRNDLCRHLKANVEQLEPTSASIILACDNAALSLLAAEIPQTPAYLKRLLDLITRVYPDKAKWQLIIINLLRNSTGKLTSECVTFLAERGCAELVAQSMLDWLNSHALQSPVISWIIKNRNTQKYASIVEPLINHKLLTAILQAIDNEALRSTSTRRIPLAEELSDDQKLIPDLLKDANDEIARDLAQSLLLNQGFEPLTKKSILARFIKLYQSIQNLVADETSHSEQLVVSQWSLDARRNELKDINENKIPENKKAVAAAKEHGDLKENSEYKMARQEGDTLAARKAQLENDLTLGRVTDFSDAPVDTVGIGSIVEILQNDSPTPIRHTILGAWDSDPDKGILSYKTPLAQKLLSKKVGETFQTEIDGNVETWKISSISRWTDTQK